MIIIVLEILSYSLDLSDATAADVEIDGFTSEREGAVKKARWIALTAVVVGAMAAWMTRGIVIDTYMAGDFVVINSTMNARKACLTTNDAEVCAYARAPGYTRLKAMCSETLDDVVFADVCPIGMIQGRSLENDRAFAARKRP